MGANVGFIGFETALLKADDKNNKPVVQTVVLPSLSNVLVTCALQKVNPEGSGASAEVTISAYVQNGVSIPDPTDGKNLSAHILSLVDITSVTFTLTVTNATATATGLIILLSPAP